MDRKKRIIFFCISFFFVPSVTFALNNVPALNWLVEGIGVDDTVVIGKNGDVYVRNGTGKNLYALNQSGKKLWEYKLREAQMGVPFAGKDGNIYITITEFKENKNYIVRLSSDKGQVEWKTELPSISLWTHWLHNLTVASDGTVYLVSDTILLSLDRSGKILWSFEFLHPPSPGSPALSPDEKVVYVYRRNKGGLFAINIDGTLKWKKIKEYFSNVSPPALGINGDVYIADANTESVYAFNPSGHLGWRRHFPGKLLHDTYPVAGEDGLIYFQVNDDNKNGMIYSLKPENGEVNWSFPIKGGIMMSSVLISKKGVLYYPAPDGHIYCLNLSGKLLWKYDAFKNLEKRPFIPFSSFPALYDGNFYIISADERLLSIRVEE